MGFAPSIFKVWLVLFKTGLGSFFTQIYFHAEKYLN